ncbi:MAG: hypothetical protein IKJ31_01640 [Bacteroidaceae bacterium]|nr:hypothetical protein [Bacteroidaceae bacterium]
MFELLIFLLVYFLGYKKYYIKLTNIDGVSKEKLIEILKYDVGLSLTQIGDLQGNLPYVFEAGKWLKAFTLARKLRSNGLECKMVWRLWKSVEEGYARPLDYPEEPEGENVNNEAWAYANEAYSLAMRELKDERVAFNIKSPEEAMRVDELLDKAEKAADAPHESTLVERINMLRNSVSWSLTRQWTHSWMIIGGVFLSIIILFYYSMKNKGAIDKAEQRLALVEDWQECDTILTEYPSPHGGFFTNVYDNANNYKIYMLHMLYREHYEAKESAENYAESAAKAADSDKRDEYLDSQEKYEDMAEEYLEKYEDFNEMDFDDVQDAAIEECEDMVSHLKGGTVWVNFLLFLAIVMTPLYILASYQYGYVIVKYEEDSKFINSIRDLAFGIAASLLGTVLATKLLPDIEVTTYLSNGQVRKDKEVDAGNFLIFARMLALIIIAVLVLCCVSFIIMTYSTVVGLYRNYQWKPIIERAKGEATKLQKRYLGK